MFVLLLLSLIGSTQTATEQYLLSFYYHISSCFQEEIYRILLQLPQTHHRNSVFKQWNKLITAK